MTKNINKHLEVIKKGIYGREVRDAIHDGIKQAYEDSIDSGDTNKEVILARGTHSYLGNRLDYFENRTSSNLDSLNKSTEDIKVDVAKALYQSENSKITGDRFLNNTIKSSHLRTTEESSKIRLNNLHEEVKQAMTGKTSINVIPANNSVTIEKLAPELRTSINDILDVLTIENEEWII